MTASVVVSSWVVVAVCYLFDDTRELGVVRNCDRRSITLAMTPVV